MDKFMNELDLVKEYIGYFTSSIISSQNYSPNQELQNKKSSKPNLVTRNLETLKPLSFEDWKNEQFNFYKRFGKTIDKINNQIQNTTQILKYKTKSRYAKTNLPLEEQT